MISVMADFGIIMNSVNKLINEKIKNKKYFGIVKNSFYLLRL